MNQAFRRVSAAIHRLDHTVARASGARRVLVELRTPVYYGVLAPIFEQLGRLPDVELRFTSEYPDRITPLVGESRFLTHRQVEWMRFDVYLNADPWAAARLKRCASRVNFFHGVAGKYDLDAPVKLPMGFQYYERVAFINRDRMQRYLDARIVTAAQARLIGYPKLDRLAAGRVDGRAAGARLGLHTDRPTVMYAPTYSPASSLHLAGEAIVSRLADAGFNVVVKLHDRSLDSDPRYTAGVDWRARMGALERPGQVVYVETYDATPYLAAADALVTDHSSIGFEYLVLDRPLVVFDAPDLARSARINPEKVALLRGAASVVTSAQQLPEIVARELADPDRLSARRRRVAADMFHRPGTATERAVALVTELMETAPGTVTADASPAASGGLP